MAPTAADAIAVDVAGKLPACVPDDPKRRLAGRQRIAQWHRRPDPG